MTFNSFSADGVYIYLLSSCEAGRYWLCLVCLSRSGSGRRVSEPLLMFALSDVTQASLARGVTAAVYSTCSLELPQTLYYSRLLIEVVVALARTVWRRMSEC